MKNKKQLHIIWGVSGGIAIYKVLDGIHQFVKDGHKVHVVMTETAKQFIQPMTFACISKNSVIDNITKHPLSHIDLAQSADVFIIAPASYNIIGKISHGIADDALTTIASAIHCTTKRIAPAMNNHMYNNPILQSNIQALKQVGYDIIDPKVGYLACGSYGIGRLANIDDIISDIISPSECTPINGLTISHLFKNKKIIITAGGTIERIDPMRFIGNQSTGKMGICLAQLAHRMGADVSFIYSNIKNPLPKEITKYIYAESAKQLLAILKQEIPHCDMLIMNAAVGDYALDEISKDKIKKDTDTLQLNLHRNPDILKELSAIKQKHQRFVGFCAETSHLLESAKKKMIEKNLDLIIANPLANNNHELPYYLDIQNSQSDYNQAILLFADETMYTLNKTNKWNLSFSILKYIFKHFYSTSDS